MNKIKILLSIVCVIVTGAVVVGALFYSGVLPIDKSEEPGVFEYYNDYGKMWTENNWQWKPAKIKSTPQYTDIEVGSTNVIHLHLSNNDYFTVEIPTDYEYYWDYGKCVYAKNGEFAIRIVGSADKVNLSKLAGINNPVNVTSTLLTNEPEKKSYRVLATLIGDTGYAIICEIYSGDDVFKSLCDSLMHNTIQDYFADTSSVTMLDSLPTYSGKYASRVAYGELTLETKKYMFADGDLYMKTDVRNIRNIENEYITLLTLMAGTSEVSEFRGSGYTYFECGDAYLGMFGYNPNTTVIAIGKGEESKCNILDLLRSLM